MNTTLELSELNEKIGQVFMIGIPTTRLDDETKNLIRDCQPGGVILFSRNIEDPIQLAGLCRELQKHSLESSGTPLFLAVDQEGGRVARLREPFTVFPGNRAIGLDPEPLKRALEFGRITAREMKTVGLNMNLAPVVDVQQGVPEKHLEDRMFGSDPGTVGELGRAVVRSLQGRGVMAVAKHFPGLGPATLDPHIKLPRIELMRKEIEERSLPPFRAAIDEGVSGIMTSHAVYPALDEGKPATLSPVIVTSLLREKLGFEGLILTDDLEMGAITEGWGVAEGAAEAFRAGGDVLLICSDQDQFRKALDLLKRNILTGEIPFSRLHRSYARIMRAKSGFLTRFPKISFKKVEKLFEKS